MVTRAKAKPKTLTFGSPGVGTPPHLANEMFVRAAGIDAIHVPYKGGGALLAAMLAGEIDWSMEGPTAQLPSVQAGKLRALAVTGLKRLPELPDVSTMAEAGVTGYDFTGSSMSAVAAGCSRHCSRRMPRRPACCSICRMPSRARRRDPT